ncbi:MAG: 50S ribosomal protein L4 [Patescibacteria group bacterium]
MLKIEMEAKIYNQDGKEKGLLKLPSDIFGLPWNADLVHQVATSYMSNKRSGTADSKDRSEVAGGGKKPWTQKGTGRARHGSIRSPIWRGGGTTFGPLSEKNYTKKINKKMKSKALFTVLSKKLKDNEIFFVEELKTSKPKTKEARNVLLGVSKIPGLEKILSKKKNSAVIFTPDKNKETERVFGNFGNLMVEELRNINLLDILNYKNILIISPIEALKTLSSKIK